MGVLQAPRDDRDGFADKLRDTQDRQAPQSKAHARNKAAGPKHGKLHHDSSAEAGGMNKSKDATTTSETSGEDRVARATDGRKAATDATTKAQAEETPDAQVASTAEQAAAAAAQAAAPAVDTDVSEAQAPPIVLADESAEIADPPVGIQAADIAAQAAAQSATEAANAAAAQVTAQAAATTGEVKAQVATTTPDASAAVAATADVTTTDAMDDVATRAAQAQSGVPAGDTVPKGAATLTLAIAPAPAGEAHPAGQPTAAAVAPAATPAKPAEPAPASPVAAAASPDPGQAASAGATTAVAPQRAETASRMGAGVVAAGHHAHHAFADEIAGRVRMAVKNGGRELLLDMRPPELGHVVIRVAMHDGVLQAHIVADKPEAAKMLEQAMPHLAEALSAQGFDLAGMDVAYHNEAHERSGMAKDGRPGSPGHHNDSLDEAERPVVAQVRADGSVPLDLLV